MGTRKDIFSIDEFYHVYNRGVDKRVIFLDDNDRLRFLRLLHICNGTKPAIYRDVQNFSLDKIEVGDKIVAIGAYCLMPNHFHILFKEITDGGLVKFMGKLLTAYSMYFNKRYERTGALFGNKFKSAHLDTDEYLKYLYSYIHLNPVKLIDPAWKERGVLNLPKTEKFLKNYTFSSYRDYIGEQREFGVILNTRVFPEYFSSESEAVDNMKEWLSFSSQYQDSNHAKEDPM